MTDQELDALEAVLRSDQAAGRVIADSFNVVDVARLLAEVKQLRARTGVYDRVLDALNRSA
jgi:hypothetical protein